MAHGELIDLERQGWRALASTGEQAADFYDRILDREPVMVLPGHVRAARRRLEVDVPPARGEGSPSAGQPHGSTQNGGGSSLGSGPVAAGGGGFGTGSSGGRYR